MESVVLQEGEVLPGQFIEGVHLVLMFHDALLEMVRVLKSDVVCLLLFVESLLGLLSLYLV